MRRLDRSIPFWRRHRFKLLNRAWVHVYCNTSSDPPKATFAKTDNTSIKSISDSVVRVSTTVATRCDVRTDGLTETSLPATANYTDQPYTVSKENKFTVIGCIDYGWLTSGVQPKNVSNGCLVFCSTSDDARDDSCSGNGCCQSSIAHDGSYYTTHLLPLVDKDDFDLVPRAFNPCVYAFLGEENTFRFNYSTDLNDTSLGQKIEATVPTVLEWAIGNVSCDEAEATGGLICQSNSKCVSSSRETSGYRCVCKEGYKGNPYLPPGCQDIDECKEVDNFPCYGTCVNTIGNYTCKCKEGYYGDAKIHDNCRREPIAILRISLGMGFGFLAILGGILVSYYTAQRRKLIRVRRKCFEKNGGMLLLDKLKTKDGVGISSLRIFQVEELKEATKNYAEDRILGEGGNGIVYKGILPDNQVVAIKKSQKMDQEQRDQFINEIVVLTQISHQNVVQLLGCCLETDVPLLVYEFISNDTLHHHIHNQTSRLSWDDRLRIAHESASALAYLHTDARISIIHRDVKSTNILLDDNYTAKVADFGASRFVPLGHAQVSTLVQGTLGYLDPEYFHTGQLTDRSDVYSFGVVLVEFLTGQKPLTMKQCLDGRDLATNFVKAMKENEFAEILDRRVVDEATNEQIKGTSHLVCRCLNQISRNRPSMKQVTMELETLRTLGKHPCIREASFNQRGTLMIESEDVDLYSVPLISDSFIFSDYGSSSGTTH